MVDNTVEEGGLHRRPIILQCGNVSLPVDIHTGEGDEESLTERRREMDYHAELDIVEGEQQ